MEKNFLEILLSRIFHDILSPLSTLSLALEAVSDDIDKSTLNYMNASIDDLRVKIDLFKILSTSDSATFSQEKLFTLINEDAQKSNIKCLFSNFQSDIKADIAKILIYLYLVLKKAIIKNGNITFVFQKDFIKADACSQFSLDIVDEIINISKNIDSATSTNIYIVWMVKYLNSINKKLIANKEGNTILLEVK